MIETVADLMERLAYLPPQLPVIVHYDGNYEAPIIDVRLATEGDRRRAVQQKGEHVVVEVCT